jgi:CRP-like cAMP-binding protein
VQIKGGAWCLSTEDLRAEFQSGGVLQQQVLRHFQATLTQTSQSVLCNQLHTLEERLCRWLLTISDRLGRGEFPLTEEFMEQMLGTSRERVAVTTSALQAKNLIEYTPGAVASHIAMLDRAGLENATCACYRVIRYEFKRLFRQPKEGR